MREKIIIIFMCLILLFGLASCIVEPKQPIETYTLFGSTEILVWHDNNRNVTCWILIGWKLGGLSCIPDYELEEPK